MMSRLSEISLLILCIVLIAWLLIQKSCNEQGIITRTDTTYVAGIPDTVIVHDTVKVTVKEFKPVYVEVSPDTVRSDCDSVRTYQTDALGAKISSRVKGKLLSQSVEIIIPTNYITRVDTVKLTNTVKSKHQFVIGGGVDMQLQPIGYVQYQRQGKSVQVMYNFITKSPMLGVGVVF